MDIASASVSTNCPCGGYGVAIHPAWAALYQAVCEHQFTCQADYEAFWRARNCPTDHSGRLILPPEEVPCPQCTGARVAA